MPRRLLPDGLFPVSEGLPQYLPQLDSVQIKSSERPVSQAYAEAILAGLHSAVSAGTSDPDAILNRIAEEAQTLTGATGAAIALLREGAVVCCARSGETAPNVGTRLSVDSGISGECLRTAKPLRCDDSYIDPRVDPVVCRVLGLRSVAIVPVCEKEQAAGILETFSTRAYAFNEQHVGYLKQLAGLIEIVRRPKRQAGQVSSEEVRPEPVQIFSSTATPASLTDVAPVLARALEIVSRAQKSRRSTRLVLAGVAVLSLSLWWLLHEPTKSAVHNAGVTYSEPAPTPFPAEEAPEEAEIILRAPVARHPASKPTATGKGHASARASETREEENAPDVVTQVEPASQQPATVPASQKNESAASTATSETVVEPDVVFVPTDNKAFSNLLAASHTDPKFAPPISSGITAAVLQHRVDPTYPPSALTLRLRGSVVLQITIGEDGKVRDLKVVNGNPILARAAVDAVRQWRYRPTMLDGKPTQSETNVRVNFEAR